MPEFIGWNRPEVRAMGLPTRDANAGSIFRCWLRKTLVAPKTYPVSLLSVDVF